MQSFKIYVVCFAELWSGNKQYSNDGLISNGNDPPTRIPCLEISDEKHGSNK